MNGSCLCGQVRYCSTGTPIEMTHCHCSACRKAHGAAFATFVRVPQDGLEIAEGSELLREYRSTKAVRRAFCSGCGAPLFFYYDPMPEIVFLVAGCLDDDPEIRPHRHIFVGSMAPWHEITDDLPQHQGYPES